MKFYLVILTCILWACDSKNKSTAVNLVVMEKGDTLSYFKYGDSNSMKYEFFDRNTNLNNVVESKIAQTKLIGMYSFGFRDKTDTLNRLLAFSGIPISNLIVTQEATMSFLHEEFNLHREYEVKLITNYLDSTGGQPRKYELQIALDIISGDTLLYQESTYAFRMPERQELILTLLIYHNQKARQDMLSFLDDVREKINRSSIKTD